MAKRRNSNRKSRKQVKDSIPSHDASELAFVAFTRRTGHLSDSAGADVVNRLESPKARKIGKALLGKAPLDKGIIKSVRQFKHLTSTRTSPHSGERPARAEG
jgi:hypothetical protein